MNKKSPKVIMQLIFLTILLVLPLTLQAVNPSVLTVTEFNQKLSTGLPFGNYMVKGYVTEKRTPCPPCPPMVFCEPCSPPYIILSDNEEEIFLIPQLPLQQSDVDELELMSEYMMTLRKNANNSIPDWIAYQKVGKRSVSNANEKTAVKIGTGIIKIDSRPSGAIVLINGKQLGKTPLSVNVHAGTMSVLIFQASGENRPVEKLVFVKAGQTVDLGNIEFEYYGKVNISSKPSNAQVTMDSKLLSALTPLIVKKIKIGTHHTVTISLSGYKSWSKEFTMDSEDKSFHAILEPIGK